MADWEEIKRLASDFQRAQLSSAVQRLSERNCIEIVKKLIDMKLINLIFTSDGKEYITPEHLEKEIMDELHVHGGRINLTDLQHILNVDFNHIENKSLEMSAEDPELKFVLGQLINKDYLDHFAEEVNDKLEEIGYLPLTELIISSGLPRDFLLEVLELQIGKIIHGKFDSDITMLYTDSYIDRCKAKIRGFLRAVTRPISFSSVISSLGLQDKLVFSIVHDLVQSQDVAGTHEGKFYIPNIYSKSQNKWVDDFYKQNGYLEFDALTRLGISDPKLFVKKHFTNEMPIFLNTCCIGQILVDQIEVLHDDVINNGLWVDVMPHVPSILSESDIEELLKHILKHKKKSEIHILCQTFLINDKFITTVTNCFTKLMPAKAEKDTYKVSLLLSEESSKKSKAAGIEEVGKKDKKEERRKKAASASKSGGGIQGRESKTKSLKKKGRGKGNESDEDDYESTNKSGFQKEIEFMTVEEMEKTFKKEFSDCPENLVKELIHFLHSSLTEKYQEIARSVFLATVAATGMAKKKAYEETLEKLNGLFTNIKLFEKGLKLFPEETCIQLTKHLLKTIVTDATNIIFNYLGSELINSAPGESSFTSEVRVKLLSKLEEPAKGALTKLHSSLNAKTLDDFFTAFDGVMGSGLCEMTLKKVDKKKEKQIVLEHRHSLIQQLEECQDSAMTMHLTVLILFQTFTNCILHASGRFVPQITVFLQKYLPVDSFDILSTFQGLVIKQLSFSSQSEDSPEDVFNQLQQLLPQIKMIAISPKKAFSAQESET